MMIAAVVSVSACSGIAHAAAEDFMPVLRFDSSERWRPLNVIDFANEGDHLLCYGTSVVPTGAPPPAVNCVDFGIDPSTQQMAAGMVRGGNTWLYINGKHPGTDAESYHSPNSGCRTDVLLDCDSGTASKIYYHTLQHGAYDYHDFWWFYRFNAGGVGPFDDASYDHQGDWEGMTVAVSQSDATRFDYVAFAQHAGVYRYLRDVLRCDAGGTGTCGDDSTPVGKRVWVYVANGTHASYPEPCEKNPGISLFPPQINTEYCKQSAMIVGSIARPENHFDGAAPWGKNADAAAAAEMPPFQLDGTGPDALPLYWPHWEGRWGNNDASGMCYDTQSWTMDEYCEARFPGTQDPNPSYNGPMGDGPLSPGAPNGSQRQRFWEPWNVGTPTEGASGVSSSTSGTQGEAGCASWFGPFTSAVACDPTSLKNALGEGGLGQSGSLRIYLASHGGRVASAPGLAQAVGKGPLVVGDSVKLRGTGANTTELHLRAIQAGQLVEAEFDRLGLANGGEATVNVDAVGDQLLMTLRRPDGILVRPSEVKTAPLP
jgi:hypothetical protein